MNKNKWWVIAFLLLVIMNIVTVATLWVFRDNKPPRRMNGAAVTDFLVRELGFDSAQKKALLALREENQEQTMKMRGKTRDAKDALFALLQKQDVPDSVIEKAAYASVYNDQQIDLLTFRHFQKIRNLCTEAQKPKFDAIIADVIRAMGPPPPGGNQPPPPMGGEEGPRPPRREPPPPHE